MAFPKKVGGSGGRMRDRESMVTMRRVEAKRLRQRDLHEERQMWEIRDLKVERFGFRVLRREIW